MSGARLLPFKAKAEERSAKGQAGDSAEGPPPVAKKPCTAYDKQFAKMDGDVTFIKDGFPIGEHILVTCCCKTLKQYQEGIINCL